MGNKTQRYSANHDCKRRASLICFRRFLRENKTLKYKVLFSLKDKSKKLKCRPLQFLFGALRVKLKTHPSQSIYKTLLHVQYDWERKFTVSLAFIQKKKKKREKITHGTSLIFSTSVSPLLLDIISAIITYNHKGRINP